MTDKEDRILITKCSGWCHALRVSCDPFDDDGMFCDKSGKWVRITEKDCAKCKDPVLYGISRQEAIEKMAKAIFTQIWGLPNNRFDLAKSSVKVRNRKLAEAALNALLEDKK